MRYYSNTLKQRVKAGPNTLGLQLARLAVLRELSVKEIAFLLGTARMTVYNWFGGGTVTQSYRAQVTQLINILKTASDSDVAWSKACKQFQKNTT
jgi:hypothetical protein